MLKLQILMNNYSAVSLLCDMISRCGLPIDIVGAEYNGALGLEQLKLYKPQIIILDRSLPVIGVERYLTLIVLAARSAFGRVNDAGQSRMPLPAWIKTRTAASSLVSAGTA